MAAEILRLILKQESQGEALKEAKGDTDALSKATGMLKSALGGAAVLGVAKQAVELAKMGAQAQRAETAFENLSGGTEEASENLQAMQEATRGAMSEMDMMAAANKLMSMGLADSAEELGNVSEMAVTLGSAFGKDAGTSIEEFSLMLANMSIPRLDTFGMSGAKARQRILELQAAMPGLSRETAFMQATMEQGAVAMERLGGRVEDNALAFERLAAWTEDAKIEAGKFFADVGGAAADTLFMIADGIKAINEAQKLVIAEALKTADSAVELVDTLSGAHIGVDVLHDAIVKSSTSYADYRAAIDATHNPLLRAYAFASKVTEATWAQTSALEIHNAAIEDDRRAMYDWTEAALIATRAQADWVAITEDDRRAVYDFTQTVEYLDRVMLETADAFNVALTSGDSLEMQLYETAVAAGEGGMALAQLAFDTGEFTTDTILAALKAAEFKEILRQYAEGAIGLDEAREKMREFKDVWDNMPTEKVIRLKLDIIGSVPPEFQQGQEGAGPGVPEYQGGAWRVPRNQLALLHAGEMVVPPAVAERVREQAINSDNRQYVQNLNAPIGMNTQQRGALMDQFALLGRM